MKIEEVEVIRNAKLIAEDEYAVTADNKFGRTTVKLYRAPLPVWFLEVIDEIYNDDEMLSAEVGETIEPIKYYRKVFKIDVREW